MADEWMMVLRELFGSDIAVGFYITATVVLIPVAIYYAKRGDWGQRVGSYSVLGIYAILSLIMLGLLGRQFVGDGINVLIGLLILLGILIWLHPRNDAVVPYDDGNLNKYD